jgi:hypothetical protein
VVRPFACLVAMGWRQRAALAMQLGWSLASSADFGDAHSEARPGYTTPAMPAETPTRKPAQPSDRKSLYGGLKVGP